MKQSIKQPENHPSPNQMNMLAAAEVINHYCKYKENLSLRDLNANLPPMAIPDMQQITKLVKEVITVESNKTACFLNFIANMSFYIPEASIYDLALVGLANILAGLNKQIIIE